ncbi:MAG TPA: hypothetical protein VHE81_16645, partial [Lacipirellulaceae bacterium]|nr:hypothetical protein [Lacipirellulaceae bacterium]
NLTSDPANPSSWTLSNDANSSAPEPVLSEVIDNPGGDVGSPGFVPGMLSTLDGDYNGDGAVDAADYVLWRHAIATSTPLPHDTTPDSVSGADYDLWRVNFARALAIGSGLDGRSVPEPAAGLLATLALSVFVCRVSVRN